MSEILLPLPNPLPHQPVVADQPVDYLSVVAAVVVAVVAAVEAAVVVGLLRHPLAQRPVDVVVVGVGLGGGVVQVFPLVVDVLVVEVTLVRPRLGALSQIFVPNL